MATYNYSLRVESNMAVENVELKEKYWNTGRQYKNSSALKNFPHFAQILSYFASVLTRCPGDSVILAVPLWPDCKTTFNTTSGGPTRWKVCFLSPFMQRRREVAHLLPTRGFYRQAQTMPYCLHPAGAPIHLSLSQVPFCSCRTYLQGHCQKVTAQAESLMTSILVISG